MSFDRLVDQPTEFLFLVQQRSTSRSTDPSLVHVGQSPGRPTSYHRVKKLYLLFLSSLYRFLVCNWHSQKLFENYFTKTWEPFTRDPVSKLFILMLRAAIDLFAGSFFLNPHIKAPEEHLFRRCIHCLQSKIAQVTEHTKPTRLASKHKHPYTTLNTHVWTESFHETPVVPSNDGADSWYGVDTMLENRCA